MPTSPYYIYCPKIISCHLQIATLVLGHHPDHFSSEGINREPWGRIFLTFLTGKKWPLIPTLCFLSFKQLSLSCHCVTSPSLLLCKGTAQVKVQLHCTSWIHPYLHGDSSSFPRTLLLLHIISTSAKLTNSSPKRHIQASYSNLFSINLFRLT